MAMRIYTKGGDKGMTALATGGRVRKDHALVDAYGILDELNALVGYFADSVFVHAEKDKLPVALLDMLIRTQHILFTVSTEIASLSKQQTKHEKLTRKHAEELEQQIDLFTSELPPLRNFILPSGQTLASLAHVCRTVCRRAERSITALSAEYAIRAEIYAYVNRLSDWFFTVARLLVHRLAGQERLFLGDVL